MRGCWRCNQVFHEYSIADKINEGAVLAAPSDAESLIWRGVADPLHSAPEL